MGELAVTAVGADRPGIIARVTGVLHDLGGNIEDASSTILGGQFAMMLLVDTPIEPAVLESALAAASADLGLFVTVRAVGEGSPAVPPTHVLTVYGADRPGIVRGVAQALADRGVNVTDLTTRVLEGEGSVYVLMMEISLPPDEDADALTGLIADAVSGVEVRIRPLDAATF
ncbi:MAG: ACT domain-containing protein [Egibacteraceae bacterium]